MAGKANETRERAIIDDFVAVIGDLRVVAYRDKPDAEVEHLATGRRIGIEVTELLEPTDGKDRSLESVVCESVLDVCRELLGPSGSVDAQIEARPRDRKQVERWLTAFRAWLASRRQEILARGVVDHRVFPDDLGVAFAEAGLHHFGDTYAAELEQARDLDWLHIVSIRLANDDRGWRAFGFPGGDHVAERHGERIDELVLSAIAKKCEKAKGYDFDGPLWLLIRNTVLATPGEEISRQIASLAEIDQFEQVWLLDIPVNVLDATRPPSARCLYRRERQGDR